MKNSILSEIKMQCLKKLKKKSISLNSVSSAFFSNIPFAGVANHLQNREVWASKALANSDQLFLMQQCVRATGVLVTQLAPTKKHAFQIFFFVSVS